MEAANDSPQPTEPQSPKIMSDEEEARSLNFLRAVESGSATMFRFREIATALSDADESLDGKLDNDTRLSDFMSQVQQWRTELLGQIGEKLTNPGSAETVCRDYLSSLSPKAPRDSPSPVFSLRIHLCEVVRALFCLTTRGPSSPPLKLYLLWTDLRERERAKGHYRN